MGDECFVATAVYGGETPEVEILRRNVRDGVLMKNYFGRLFVRAYYNGLGEAMSVMVRQVPSLKPLFRKGLDYIVEKNKN